MASAGSDGRKDSGCSRHEGLRASFKALRFEMLSYYAARCLSAEFVSGNNYFDIDAEEDYNRWREKAWSHFLSDPLVEKSHLLDRSDPSHCYIKMAFLTALLTKSRSLYRQKQSMSSDIGLRNDFLELLSKIVGIVKTGIFTEDMGDHLEPEEMYVELLVQNFIATARRGILSDAGAFARSMRSADVANEFNRVLGTKIAGANEEKMSELVKGVREEIKKCTFSTFEESHGWGAFFDGFWSLLKRASVRLTLYGPFPRLHPRLAELQGKDVADSGYRKSAENVFIGENLGPGEMRELVDYISSQQSKLTYVLKTMPCPSKHTSSRKKTRKQGPRKSSTEDASSPRADSFPIPESSPATEMVPVSIDTSIVLRTPGPTNRRPRRHWAQRDVDELARLLNIHHGDPQRWRKILEIGLASSFFIGRSNVDLKDKARQMKEASLRENKNPGVWRFAVDR